MDFVFGRGEAYPVSFKSLDDVVTTDAGLPEFTTEHAVTRLGHTVTFRFLLPGWEEQKFVENLIENLPSKHWTEKPLTEVRVTNRSISVWVNGQEVQAAGVYTPNDQGVYLKRLTIGGRVDYQTIRKVFLHEFGHHWLEQITPGRLGHTYKRIAEDLGLQLGRKKLANYQEFWAEAYSIKVLRSDVILSKYPEVFRMIEETE